MKSIKENKKKQSHNQKIRDAHLRRTQEKKAAIQVT